MDWDLSTPLMRMTTEREWETRKKRIDPRLEAAGWPVVRYRKDKPSAAAYGVAAVEEFETDNGPADYGLCGDDAVLGVVEAKKVSVGPQGVLTQAERYSRGLTDNPFDYPDGFRAPFLYSTNGEVIWFHDVRHPPNRSRRISGFHTPPALRELLERDFGGALASLEGIPKHTLLRPYQHEAVATIEKAIADGKRQMLVAMATGTGKTLTVVSQAYRLMKSGAARRILFLVDRRALAAQAVRAFASFEAEPGFKFDKIYEIYSQRFQRDDFGDDEPFDPKVLPNSYLTDPQPGHAFVYVSTIQRMTFNLFGRDAVFSEEEAIDPDVEQLDIPIHAFDLIIADECHRGYSTRDQSVWRNTLDHFDAVKIGLTATPAAHTKAYFKDVVYRYDYGRAVREGYLVDYDAVSINSRVRMEGIFLHEGEQVAAVDTATGQQQLDVLEDEREYDTTTIEQKITAPDSNQKILREVASYAAEHEEKYGRFPKTLIFAVNDLPHTSHTDQLVDLARDVFGRGDAFVAKITGKADRPLQRIREFRNRPNPGVAVTVDMLSTGVDIPDLEFIVFLRPVKSRILFEQMVGRGTRKGERHTDKSHFVVFDCFDGTLLEYFRNSTGITAEPPVADGKTIEQIIEEIWGNQDREYNTRRLVKRLHRIDKEMSGDAIELFARFVPGGDLGSFANELAMLLHSEFVGTMATLRDPDLQKLLNDYPRPPRTFLIAEQTEDVVDSEWLIRNGSGKEYKPEDYLAAFGRFVRENEDDVDSIAILLGRPSDWGTEPLVKLREALSRAPEHFTEKNLQRAFHATHHKALVDIISMVKRAADDQSEMLTAEERVDRAVELVTAGVVLTDDQREWLGYIRGHLIENLSVDREDFTLIPILSNRGGWGRANKVFDGSLSDLLSRLNSALVKAA